MWNVKSRARYDRNTRRYPSDLTDEEWALARREIPPAKRGGNKRMGLLKKTSLTRGW